MSTKTFNICETVQNQCYYDELIGNRILAFDWYQNLNDLGWPWTAETHSCGKIILWSPPEKFEWR